METFNLKCFVISILNPKLGQSVSNDLFLSVLLIPIYHDRSNVGNPQELSYTYLDKNLIWFFLFTEGASKLWPMAKLDPMLGLAFLRTDCFYISSKIIFLDT